ncbi:unnamed protein product [Staurois parvus]|uniref:Uncharacterized protein n=1 Tax=Staurois parvus TaxID=386267 RepID=A0ABN9BVF2_9NEOB|nr:unnamed protein product [Staurois parvus]
MPVIGISLLSSCHADCSDHQDTDDQCAMMINATCQYHICATYQCPSELPVSAAHQCHLPVPPHLCNLSVPITAASLAHIREGEKSLIYKIL